MERERAAWQRFAKTGKVSDYLAYRRIHDEGEHES